MRVVLVRPMLKRRDDSGRILIHRQGDLLDLGDVEGARLLALGIVADEADEPMPPPAPEVEVDEQDPEVEADEPMPVEESSGRPRNSAPIEEWRRYAEAQGIDSKGLSKAELRAVAK